MSVGELCNRNVVIIEPGASIREAARLMRSAHVGDIVIVEQRDSQRMPVGMLTDRDIALEIVAEGLDPGQISVGEAMSTSVITAREDEDLVDVVERMRSHGVRRIPIVNARGGLEGILAVDDVLELLAEQVNGLVGLVRIEQRQEQERRSPRRSG